MKKTSSLLIAACSVFLISACSTSSNTSSKVDTTDKAMSSNAASQAPASATAKSVVAPVVVPAHLDPNSALSKNRSVYFDFDKFQVKDEYKSVVESHGKYVGSQGMLKIKIEGNADERGGREYNLALGQKRADAVARALKVYGVKDQQVEAVSFGSEKPAAAGHDETAWAQNRRADVTYVGK
jgi:peptidoglycan-associated lipoprotein